jgi:hypothetical protein
MPAECTVECVDARNGKLSAERSVPAHVVKAHTITELAAITLSHIVYSCCARQPLMLPAGLINLCQSHQLLQQAVHAACCQNA